MSCQEPQRFSQNLESQSQPRRFYYAQLGEPLCHRGTPDTRITDGTFELRHTFVIRHLAFGIFQTIPTESSPQTISLGDPYRGRSTPHPRHGWPWEWSPQTTLNPTIRKQLKQPMKKSFIISSLTALAALCLCVNAQAQGPVVVSDKDDYSPGRNRDVQRGRLPV